MFTTWGEHKEKAGVVKLGCFCAAARGTHCSDQTDTMSAWSRHNSKPKHTKCNYDQEKHSLYRFDPVHARCMPERMMRTSPLHWTFPRESTTSTKCPASKEKKKKKQNKKPKYIETALLWMLPSRFCGCGCCSRSVQSSQTERAAMFFCLTMNANSTRSTLACLAVVFFPVRLHARAPIGLCRLTGFLRTGKYQTTACLQSGSVELKLQVMSINSM